MNPYAQNNPYIMQAQGLDQQGLNPVFQNIASQQANQNAMLAQQNQLMNQASGVGGSGGMNPLAMAMALRNKKPKQPEMMGTGQTPNWQNPYANYDNGSMLGSSGIE
jgi:hypothetical protein